MTDILAPINYNKILLCPGPVMVSDNVKKSLLHNDIGHRESEFTEVLLDCRTKLNKVFGVTGDSYTNVILTGSGTLANEAILSSYGPNKRLLLITNGEFGDRLIELAQYHKLNYTALNFHWKNPIDLNVIENIINKDHYDAVMVVHHETSTGMLNPIKQIGILLKKYDIDFLVDAISSLGAEELSVEDCNITFCSSSSNKAIGSLPGLSFVCGKKSAFNDLKHSQPKTSYLDLYKYYQYEELLSQTPNTPAISLFFALNVALNELLSISINKKIQYYNYLSKILRKGLTDLGFKFLIEEKDMSRVLTTIYYPENIDSEAFHTYLKNNNYIVYQCKGPLFNKAFQIANIGDIQKDHIDGVLRVLKTALQRCKKTHQLF